MSRAIDDAMKRLRAKVERVPSRPFHLVGVRGVGYRFVPLETAPDRRRFRVGARTVDLDRLIVEAPGEEALSLSSNEARLLELLRDREGRPMATVDLLREVWGVRDPEQRRVVDRLVYRLRAKVEDAPKSPRYLRTIRGRGLALVVEDANAAGTTSSMGTPCPVPDVEVLGRDGLIQATLDALAAPGALITLHGPAGAGKSTASQAIAQGWAGPSRYADLEPTTSASAVLLAIARALGADDAPDAPEGRVHAALRGQRGPAPGARPRRSGARLGRRGGRCRTPRRPRGPHSRRVPPPVGSERRGHHPRRRPVRGGQPSRCSCPAPGPRESR